MTYRKQVFDPLTFYNSYIQIYNKYFHNFYTHIRKKELDNKRIEEYLINFSETHFHKLKDSMEEFRKYLTWCFSKYDKVSILCLHKYIDDYLKEGTIELNSFWFKVRDYMKKKELKTWNEYIEGTPSRYPRILEHYISTKEIPFEFILYLKVLDTLTPMQKKCMKVILRMELLDLDKKLIFIDKNTIFFKYELEQIVKELKNNAK